MKRIIYFVLAILVCGIYVGCSENEIDTNFHSTLVVPHCKLLKLKIRIRHFIRLS